jgi:predicted amidophosphoribosyltransferase
LELSATNVIGVVLVVIALVAVSIVLAIASARRMERAMKDSEVPQTEAASRDHESRCPACGGTVPVEVECCPGCGLRIRDGVPEQGCLACGTSLSEGARFCATCGRPANPTSCPACSSKLSGTEDYCPQCGRQLAVKVQIAPTTVQEGQVSRAVVLLTLIVVGAVVWFVVDRLSPKTEIWTIEGTVQTEIRPIYRP